MIFDFEHRLAELDAQTVLCVGDLMLDEFVYGEVSRISPADFSARHRAPHRAVSDCASVATDDP
jgi:hypothetical protein